MYTGISHVFRCQTIYKPARTTCTSSVPATQGSISTAVNLLTKSFKVQNDMTRSIFSQLKHCPKLKRIWVSFWNGEPRGNNVRINGNYACIPSMAVIYSLLFSMDVLLSDLKALGILSLKIFSKNKIGIPIFNLALHSFCHCQ